MAYLDTITIPAHHNIYNGFNERNLRIDFGIPDGGTNQETGIFILVPGFGAHIDSNVYKKMRNQFANQYNVVTVQCDYFGSRFMQDAKKVNFPMNDLTKIISYEDFMLLQRDKTKFIEVISKYPVNLSLMAESLETENEFVDMGFMQAIDIITTIEAIKIILKENQLIFNDKRVIGFGQSHGAYLLHLANVLSPHLFSLIIDNSAWVEPVYLHTNRITKTVFNKATMFIEFNYIAKNLIINKAALSLHELYKGFNNEAYIYSCLGTTDYLVDVEDKKKSLSNLNYVHYEVIDEQDVDGTIFKSTNHGLDSDFLKLIEYVLSIVPPHINQNEKLEHYKIKSSKTLITVDYTNGLPVFSLNEIE